MPHKIPFRERTPARNIPKTKGVYRKHKKQLRKDFNCNCGYCNDDEFWAAGGEKNFHIDHFVPRKFNQKIDDYNNLIYSCPYCNISKGGDWPSNDPSVNIIDNKGYIDPCDSLYDKTFDRDNNGNIIPMSEIGMYMYEKLKFYLLRHSIIWKIVKYNNLISEVETNIRKCKTTIRRQLNNKLLELYRKHKRYIDYLKQE